MSCITCCVEEKENEDPNNMKKVGCTCWEKAKEKRKEEKEKRKKKMEELRVERHHALPTGGPSLCGTQTPQQSPTVSAASLNTSQALFDITPREKSKKKPRKKLKNKSTQT